MVGGESPLFARVHTEIKKFSHDIIFKGFISETELKTYYANAKVLAYPSFYEGFGLPPLEAMASGTPVITSNTSSLPEVVEDAALMIDPNNIDEISKALETVLLNQKLRQKLIEKGKSQVLKFNWQKNGSQSTYYLPSNSQWC